MTKRITIKSGGNYRVVRHVGHGPGGQRAHIYQIEDTTGQLICHCGSSRAEAEHLFEVLERPIRRRLLAVD